MKLPKATMLKLFALCVSTFLFFVVLVVCVVFLLKSQFDEVVINEGTGDGNYIKKMDSINLPENTIYASHYSEVGAWQLGVLYMKIKLHEINHEQKLLDDLVEISGIDTMIIKGNNDSNFEIPLGREISWWNPEVLGNFEYYESTNDHHNMQFWIDRDNNYIYFYDSD